MFKLSYPDRGLLEQTYALRFRLNFGTASLYHSSVSGFMVNGFRSKTIYTVPEVLFIHFSKSCPEQER